MPVDTISALWRYPVKSMAGEEISAADVTSRGITGDRAWALTDPAANRVGSAKISRRFGSLLQCRAEFTNGTHVRMTFPDGATLTSDQPDVDEHLSLRFGPPIHLVSRAPEGLMLQLGSDLGGKMTGVTALPVSSGAPAGTLFDYGPLHLIASSTLRALAAEYPEGNFAPQRFRPNMIVETDAPAFVENSWLGQTLAIGEEVVVRVTIPCPRCVITTLPRTDMPLDAGILRTVAKLNMVDMGDFGTLPCVGVYAEVVNPGRIQQGDSVKMI